ncbi:MAG: tetraacyldisaccharide 4'-kinase [Gemmatimonadetes bacterium]|nr:tetraacyldisaccharide 4'-kinase [Gemmatimonadota bacterium]
MTGRGVRTLVRDVWDREAPGPAARVLGSALAPPEVLFRVAVRARNSWYDRTLPPGAPIPVISVGNLTVGGTGKTPVLRWLHDWLRVRGVGAAVVTRGYGEDETVLYRQWFGDGAVFAGSDRRAGVRAASAQGHDLALLDDGFQHRRVPRALDILLLAAEDPWRVRMLPRGPYREPLSAAGRATHVLVTRRTPRRGTAAKWRERLSRVAPGVPVVEAEMKMSEWSNLDGEAVAPPRGDVLAVCSIARPGPFADGLGELLPGVRIELAAYPDHHDYTRDDMDALLARRRDRTIVCTAKDAVKLTAFPEVGRHCIMVGFRVAGEPEGPLRDALQRLAGSLCGSP